MNENRIIFRRILDYIDDGHIEMYILKKTLSSNPERQRELFRFRVDDEVVEKLRDIIRTKCNSIIDNDEITFPSFFSETVNPDSIPVVMELDEIALFRPIISQISQSVRLESVRQFDEKTMKKLHSYAIEIKNESVRIIFFKKYGKGWKISSTLLTVILQNGVFNKLEGDVFRIDSGIDAIFFQEEDREILYVLNHSNFENIFSFYDIYRAESERAREILLQSDLVTMGEGVFDSIMNKSSYIKKIALINKRGYFTTIDLQKIKDLIRKVPTLKFSIINERITIPDRDALKDFLDVCEKHIVQDALDESVFYRANKIERIG